MELGVVGSGFFAQNHLRAWANLKPRGIEIAAVSGVDSTKASAAADRFGASTGNPTPRQCSASGVAASSTSGDPLQDASDRAEAIRTDIPTCRAMAAAAQSAGLFTRTSASRP